MQPRMICRQCGTLAIPKKLTKGSIAIEIVLWLCMIFPGLIYSLWRLSSRYPACSVCRSPDLVPPETPIGQQLREKFDVQRVVLPAMLCAGLLLNPVTLLASSHHGTHSSSHSHQHRSQEAKNAFKHAQPCPSNGNRHGSCPGYVIDHVKPLACGGADAPSNMQWQDVASAKAKDKWERKACSK